MISSFRGDGRVNLGTGIMSRIEEIEQAIAGLDPTEFRALRDWILNYDSEIWDRQIEEDARNGKLARLAHRALRDHESGRT